MKKIALLTLFTLIISGQAMATSNKKNPGVVCIDNQLITQLEFGYITNIVAGPDNGSAVLVHFANGQSLPLNWYYNANDRQGKAMIDALTLAFFSQRKVTVKDHFKNDCDQFDHVILTSP
ncbi:hypothetical protein [Pseudoteredinibacter isoporae]|uniref:Uncharacterized protein n=1 Tax=Pseudoteredinibacter isoporae TaxID=570281 RepID=A0A7X0JVT4_9GAMM|nr:hypothetical protein [Pseudoteredinibacter isoporae]MBB6523182.1 hypothetical protein [Pseudoteredinibacter isoporae]NHO88700.1 hypothetical protein [Pseudoteredinibacter isoporae]NIB22609.1 hypothetical protein [Pseudoteredinibacter isoporae]